MCELQITARFDSRRHGKSAGNGLPDLPKVRKSRGRDFRVCQQSFRRFPCVSFLMKRRTRDKVGSWPNMRDDTLRAVCDELIRARKAHPSKDGNLPMLRVSVEALHNELTAYNVGKTSAVQIYARAAQLAAMAVRVLEEGSLGFKYAGNSEPPPFELTPGPYTERFGEPKNTVTTRVALGPHPSRTND
jgi:hypothetical protein